MKKSAAVVAGLILALGAATPAFADNETIGIASHSPGFLSGNVVQIPIDFNANVCGNTLNLPGALNPTFGNHCSNR
ncbi:chaplin [Streptomyces sp. NBC_00582]|uniref:chaplin n=1 Tax=Streptomyces sp. NBC_00582 TaxID=2975783 RepID=UPI001062DD43|nr:chaplin [Streptomyces sp. NBC_00582]WUB64564.1 chaplin [Streptomyces sp. NBC_00582]